MDFISLGCCLLAFLLYYNTLDAGFVYDDRRAILTNPDVLPTSSWMSLLQNDFWGTPLSDTGSHGSYRPLCVMSFRLNHLLGGFQPWGYHLVNVLLHCLATGLVVRVARKVFPQSCIPVGPAVAGLLFATHPIHTEAVAGIVGRADLAACNFYLLSFLAYVAHLKYRDQRCLTLAKSMLPGEYCICCDTHHTRAEKKHKDRHKKSSAASGNSNLKYHSFVVNLPRQVTNCNWPNRLAKSDAFVRSGNLLTSFFRAGGVMYASDKVATSVVNNGVACEIATECACNSDGGRCVWRRIKQWLALVASVALAFAAVLSKETGITVLVVCALYDVTHTSLVGIYKRQLRSLVIVGVALCAMLLLRLQITWGNTPEFATADNPAARAPSIITRFLTFSYLPTFNFRLLLSPVTLSFDWSMDAVPRVTSIFDTRNCISLFFYIILYQAVKQTVTKLYHRHVNERKPRKVIRTVRKRFNDSVLNSVKNSYCQCPVCHHSMLEHHHSSACRVNNNNNSMNSHSVCICQPVTQAASACKSVDASLRGKPRTSHATILIALAFLTLPFLPATNLFFYVGFVVAERVLYLPSVGYCLLLGLGAGRIRRARYHWRAACVALIVILLIFSLKTIRRNHDWLNEESLYRSAIPVNPPKAYGNLGSVLSGQGRIAEAEWAYRKALEHRTNMADVHYNLGNLLQGKQKYEEAIESYQRAIHFRPSLALAYVNLGAAYVAAGRCQEAVSILRQGSRLDGSGLKDRRTHDTAKVSALLQLGALYSDQGRLQRALAAYREALHTMPHYYPPQSVYNLLGETLSRLQQFEEAERWYQAALQAQPDHVPAHITYGKLLAKNGSRIAEAEQWFRRAQRLAPSDPSVYHHYGEFLASQGRHAEAAVHYVRSAELKSEDYELVVAAATALRQADRRSEAEKWYRKAVAMRPLDARGHTNLGAMLHLNGKYRQAADSYREALRLQPDDVTTLTNLHKLYSVMA